MGNLSLLTLILLSFTAFLAGIIDTIAGGGGLITVPALMVSGLNPILALGTNKLQSSLSELSATLHFLKNGQINFQKLKFYLLITALGSMIGGIILQFIGNETLGKLVPILLSGFFINYISMQSKNKIKLKNFKSNEIKSNEIKYNELKNKDLKNEVVENTSSNFSNLNYLCPLIGFYNGFFGPGTGSIWTICLMKYVKLDIKIATMYTKPLNFIGNIASLVVFFYSGKIYLLAALSMGIGSLIGGKLGAMWVIYKDSDFIKKLFSTMMLISIVILFIKKFFI